MVSQVQIVKKKKIIHVNCFCDESIMRVESLRQEVVHL